jgi:hypothetical protein
MSQSGASRPAPSAWNDRLELTKSGSLATRCGRTERAHARRSVSSSNPVGAAPVFKRLLPISTVAFAGKRCVGPVFHGEQIALIAGDAIAEPGFRVAPGFDLGPKLCVDAPFFLELNLQKMKLHRADGSYARGKKLCGGQPSNQTDQDREPDTGRDPPLSEHG